MNDDTHNTIEPDDSTDRGQAGHDRDSAGASEALTDRGMPALGQYRRARPPEN